MRCLAWGRIATAVAVAVLALVPTAPAAMAADASGCSGSAVSRDAGGTVLDVARAPGSGGTQSDPFVADPAGTVAWAGSTATPITSGTWSVSVMGIPFRSGDVSNSEGTTKAAGVQDMAALPAPVRWVLQGSMVIPVSGTVSGAGGTCTASGFVTGVGAPVGTPMFWSGLALSLLGLALLVWMWAGTGTAPLVGAPAAESIHGSEVTR